MVWLTGSGPSHHNFCLAVCINIYSECASRMGVCADVEIYQLYLAEKRKKNRNRNVLLFK